MTITIQATFTSVWRTDSKPHFSRFGVERVKINHNAFSLLYTSFIRPQLEYASDVWGGCFSSDCERLEKIQLIAARIVSGLPVHIKSSERFNFDKG